MPVPSVSYTITVRAQYPNVVGSLARIVSAIGGEGGDMGNIDLIESTRDRVTRDISFAAHDLSHAREVVRRIKAIPKVRVLHVLDLAFQRHDGGKIAMAGKLPLRTQQDLALAYTPGVARVSMRIHQEPQAVWGLTIKRNSVAVVTDGTAVLGLGDIGPEAALPVMEGKALLFKEFAGVDAWPLCLATKDPDEIVRTVKNVAPAFGGINLEDISAPRCFEIEERLKQELDIPVFHDDQHGTAVVVLAALINALKLVKREFSDLRVVISGVGAGGVACAKILMHMGVQNIIGCDRTGIVYRGRQENMNPVKQWLAEHTNPEDRRGSLKDAMDGANFFLGLSAPGLVTVDHLKRMAADPIVFAMANPDPEIMPEEAAPYVRVMATGRSDYPNQINNVLCFPGIFRGALDVQASEINEEMKLAAAFAIARAVSKRDLRENHVIPSVFDKRVATGVARAVAQAAEKTGVARHLSKDYASYRI